MPKLPWAMLILGISLIGAAPSGTSARGDAGPGDLYVVQIDLSRSSPPPPVVSDWRFPDLATIQRLCRTAKGCTVKLRITGPGGTIASSYDKVRLSQTDLSFTSTTPFGAGEKRVDADGKAGVLSGAQAKVNNGFAYCELMDLDDNPKHLDLTEGFGMEFGITVAGTGAAICVLQVEAIPSTAAAR